MSSLSLALSHAGPSTLRSLLSKSAGQQQTDDGSLEAENDQLRAQLDLQLAIAARYEEDLSARDRYVELLAAKVTQAEKLARRWRKESDKDKVLLANVQEILELECDGLEEQLKAELEERESVYSVDAASSSVGFRSMRSDVPAVQTKERSLHASNIFDASNKSRPSLGHSQGERSANQSSVGRSVNMSVSRQDLSDEQRDEDDRFKALEAASQADREALLRQTEQLNAIARERDQLISDLEAERQNSQRLATSLSAADSQLTISASAFATAKETIKELQAKERDHARAREAAEEELVSLRNEKDARVVALRQEAAKLQSGYKDETERLLSAHRAAQEGFIAREKAYQSQIGELLEQLSAMEDHGEEAETRIKMLSMEVEALAQTVNDLEAAKNQAERRSGGASDEARARIETLEKEAEQAKHRVTELERASGNKEIEITKLRRKLKAAEDDADGLNDALELKQQELELLKRKMGVRGTAGMTPLPSRGALGRTLSVPDSANSIIASSSVTESVVDARAGPLLDNSNILGRRSLSISGMSGVVKPMKNVRIAPRPSNPMEIYQQRNSSAFSVSQSNIEDSNMSEDTAATPRAGTRDKENRRSMLVPA